MLDPNEIIKLSEGSEKIASELQEEIVREICERIAIRLGRGDDYILTPRDKWQLEVLKDAGYLVDDLAKIIAKHSKRTVKEMRKAFAEAGVSSTKFDDITYIQAGIPVTPIQQSPAMIRLLERGMNKTFNSWKNFTGTTLQQSAEQFIRECDKAYNAVLSGSVGYGEAVKRALQNIITEDGNVVYPSGHRDTLEVATYRAVRTGISQAASDITSVRASENGITLFITSSHLGARPTHEPWQGKVFWVDWDKLSRALGIEYNDSREASDNEKAKYDEFVKTTEIGTVTGLCGANCRHSYGPYIEGVSHNPFEEFDSEENQKRYETEQKQRALERGIRKQKRKVEGLKAGLREMDPSVSEETEKKLRTEERKLARLRKEYKQFSDENGLKEQTQRLEIAQILKEKGIDVPASILDRFVEIPSSQYKVETAEDAEDRLKYLSRIVDTYSDSSSDYKGVVKIMEDSDPYYTEYNAHGYNSYDGIIHVRRGVSDGVLIHEYLHSKSVSKYGEMYGRDYAEEVYERFKNTEEGSVELLARKICEDLDINYPDTSYEAHVGRLKDLVAISRNYDDEMVFAREFFDIKVEDRYDFIKNLPLKDGSEETRHIFSVILRRFRPYE